MPAPSRQSTGVPGLDEQLGGGLLPGTLTVVVGATGVGKTQLGIQFAQAGLAQEGRRGLLFDMTARGDSQSHADYARRIAGWRLGRVDPAAAVDLDAVFAAPPTGEHLHVFDRGGRRVNRHEVAWDEQHAWQAEVNARLRAAIAFLYGGFVHGVRRVVVDGVEPIEKATDSIQLHLFEYVYHQVLRKEAEWVARDLFREQYLRRSAEAAARVYDPAAIGCLLLVTSRETLLDDLISRGLEEGDSLAGANTLIYLGKLRDGDRVRRGMYIAKHRGSACSERIIPFAIGEQGLRVE